MPKDYLHNWVGSFVHVEVLSGIGEQSFASGKLPTRNMGVAELEGMLTEVSERGIILLLNNTDEYFFSWNAVLKIRPYREYGGW